MRTPVVVSSDSRGCIYNRSGLEIPKLILYKERTGSVMGYPGSEKTVSACNGSVIGGILLVGRMLRHPPPVNAEH